MGNSGGLAILISRILFGLVFVAFGIIGLFQIGEQPEPAPEAGAFVEAMMETGYLFQMVKITEIACGAALLSGFFVPLALIVITPIVVNIAAFHIFLDPSGQGLAVTAVIVALLAYLTYKHWDTYKPLVRAKPSTQTSNAEAESAE